jgi:hypothetical protein
MALLLVLYDTVDLIFSEFDCQRSAYPRHTGFACRRRISLPIAIDCHRSIEQRSNRRVDADHPGGVQFFGEENVFTQPRWKAEVGGRNRDVRFALITDLL